MEKIKDLAAAILLITVFLLTASSLVLRLNAYQSGRTEYKRLQESLYLAAAPVPDRNSGDGEILEKNLLTDGWVRGWSDQMVSRNPDYIFWIWIPGTKISYPVVKSRIPGYYLNHTFSGEESPCGSIFCHDPEQEEFKDNLVLYGHNMKDGSMFADLKRYMDETYFRSHPDIWIYRQEERLHYAVFSCQVIGAGEEGVYRCCFPEEDEKKDFINRMQKSSLYETELPPGIADSLITLSTCLGKGKRVIVQAVLLCYTE